MSEKLYGGAFALFPGNDEGILGISQTIISGSNKKDINVVASETTRLALQQENLSQALEQKISRLVMDLLELEQGDGRIHITCGTPEDIIAEPIINKLFPEIQISIIDKKHHPSVLQVLISDFFKKVIPEGSNIEVEPRSYVGKSYMQVGLQGTKTKKSFSEGEGKDLFEAISAELRRVIRGRKGISDDLRRGIEVLARVHADTQKIIPEGAGDTFDSRFIGIAEERNHTNMILIAPEFREIFSRVFFEELGADHNICMKAYWEKVNPPFSDVAMTYMADSFDKIAGTLPTLVSMGNGENGKLLADVEDFVALKK